jgi:hypothetical protein
VSGENADAKRAMKMRNHRGFPNVRVITVVNEAVTQTML